MQNELMSKIYKKAYATLSYIEYVLILASTKNGWVLISTFTSFIRIYIGITSSSIGLKPCAMAAGIKNYKSIIKENKKTHDKEVLLANSKLNTIELLVSKVLIDLVIRHD